MRTEIVPGLKFLLSENDGYMWREYTFEKFVKSGPSIEEGMTWQVYTTYPHPPNSRSVANLQITSYDLPAFRAGSVVGAGLSQIPDTARFVQIKLHS